MRIKTNRTSFLRGNRSGRPNTELKHECMYFDSMNKTSPIHTCNTTRGGLRCSG